MDPHALSNFIDSIKESITDAQYKEGMDLCKTAFDTKESEEKLYRMTFLKPYTFASEHCEDCHESKLYVSFAETTALVRLNDRRAERIMEKHMFLGSSEEMKSFIDVNLLQCFPEDQEDLGLDFEWFEFPVLKLELV